VDYSRQSGLLDPCEIKKKSISIIGVGATGSYVAAMLAQLGWGDTKSGQGTLKVFDGDVVEEHNLANQVYELAHIGLPKVEALRQYIIKKCNFSIDAHNCMITKDTSPLLVAANYVFILTDTMSSRKEIYDTCLKFAFNTDLVIETRMSLKGGRVYAFNPNSAKDVEAWKETLYGDDEAEVSLCGSSSSIVSTVMFLASMAVQRVVQHFADNYGTKGDGKSMPMWNEVQFSLYPEAFYLRQFWKNPVMTM